MIKIIKYLQRLSVIPFIFIGFILIIIISAIFSILIPEGFNKNPVVETMMDRGTIVLFFSTVIFAPFIETLIFQSLPYIIVNSKLRHKKRIHIYLLSTSVLFGAVHYYNIAYIIIGVIIGFILGLFYYIGTLRKENAFVLVTIVHGLNNLLVFLLLQFS